MVPRHSRFLTDRTGRVAMNEMAQLRAALRLFEKKFPQILFSVFVDELAPGGSISEFAFWLANRARFSSVEKKGGDNFDLLLVLDLATNSAALAAGYGLEPHVSEQALRDALEALAAPLARGDVAGGIRALLDVLIPRLRELSRRAGNAKTAATEMLADAK
ncbi:MAG: TPM domain-containing protein [Chthoniobacterales bacterium]